MAAASVGAILEARGFKVSLMKFDPYVNVDPGTMSPYQHGEVFVTDDGAETDLDLGHYERFTHCQTSRGHNYTTGKIYESVINKERRGDYLGKTVLLVFTATWCPYCGAEAPFLEGVWQQFKDRGVQVVVIDVKEPAAAMRDDVLAEPIERAFEVAGRRRLDQIRKRPARQAVPALLLDRQHLHRDVPRRRIELQMVQDRPAQHVGQQDVEQEAGPARPPNGPEPETEALRRERDR